jgi:hypothetical protein
VATGRTAPGAEGLIWWPCPKFALPNVLLPTQQVLKAMDSKPTVKLFQALLCLIPAQPGQEGLLMLLFSIPGRDEVI